MLLDEIAIAYIESDDFATDLHVSKASCSTMVARVRSAHASDAPPVRLPTVIVLSPPLSLVAAEDADSREDRVLNEIRRKLCGEDERTRIDALAQLVQVGARAAFVYDDLVALLESSHSETLLHEWVAWALGEIAPYTHPAQTARARAALSTRLEDPSESVRTASLRALSRIPTDAASFDTVLSAHGRGSIDPSLFVSYLQHAARTHDAALRCLLAQQIERDHNAAQAIEELAAAEPARILRVLEACEPQEEDLLLQHLVKAAPDAIVDRLLERTRDEQASRRATAIAGLARAKPVDATMQSLRCAFTDPDPLVRWSACAHIGMAHYEDAALRSSLKARIRDQDSAVRQEATLALGRMLEHPWFAREIHELVPDFVAHLHGTDHQLACYTTWVLGKLGAAAHPALSALQVVASSSKPMLSESAQAAIEAIRDAVEPDGGEMESRRASSGS